jgi:hypothetical protein
MNRVVFLGVALLAGLAQSAHANPVSRRATITGGGGNGRCTIEVSVDHAAEVEISGDMGVLATTAGQPAAWRRFQCNSPLPPRPVDFRLGRINGRGTVRLMQDPRETRGRAVIQITDPQGGRGSYTFDIEWRGSGSGWTPGAPPWPGPGPGPGHDPGGFPMPRAIRMCRDSVTSRLNRDGYRHVTFEGTLPVDNPGRHDWITGTAYGKRAFETSRFSFSCSLDFSSGIIRSVDVRRR